MDWCAIKTKGALLQELKPKCDTSWMGYWAGKILNMSWQDIWFWNIFYIPAHELLEYSKLEYLVWLLTKWDTHQANLQVDLTKYSNLEYVVHFHLCKLYVVVHYPLLNVMYWLDMGIADWIWLIVGPWNIWTKSNLKHHLMIIPI